MDGLVLIACGIVIIMLSKMKREKGDDYKKGFQDGRASVLNEKEKAEDE